jgi:hypothetical protein
MAVQVVELPQQPSPMGLEYLGNALQEGAQGYVAEKDKERARQNQLDDEARRRSEALSDVQDQRAYQSDRDKQNRLLDRSDADYIEKARADAAALHEKGEYKAKITAALVEEGYLSPDKIDDQASVQAAWAAAKHDGVVQRYQALVSGGFLKVGDLDDPKKVAAAQDAAAKDSTAKAKTALDNRQAGVSAAGSVATQIQQEQAKIRQIEGAAQSAVMAASQPPSQQAVMSAAAQLAAQSARIRDRPSRDEIQAAIPQATAELRQHLQEAAAQADQQAKILIADHERSLAALTARATQFDKAGIFAEPTTEDAGDDAGPDVLSPAAPAANPAANKAAVLGSLFGRPAAGGPAGGAPAPAPAPAAQPGPGPAPAAAPQSQPAPTQGGFPDLTSMAASAVGAGAGHVVDALGDIGSGASGAIADRIRANTNLLGGNPTPALTPVQQALGDSNQLKTQIAVILKQNPNADVSALRQKLTAAQMRLQQLQQQKLAAAGTSQDTLGQPATLSAAGQPAFSDAGGASPVSSFSGGNYWNGGASGPQ